MNKLNNIENEFEQSMIGLAGDKMFVGLMGLIHVKTILNYKDLRAVRNWCRKHNVFIIKQGNKSYVNKWEFILSFHKQFIEHLKAKHKNWKKIFIAYLKGNLNHLVDTSEKSGKQLKVKKYVSKSREEKLFLSKMKKL